MLLIDRALHAHWDFLRLFLLSSHGGLLRSAVRSFAGVKLSKIDLLSVCDDTKAVIEALGKSKKSKNGASFPARRHCPRSRAPPASLADRILPYDPSISQIRNAWRQQALWEPTAELVLWSAATTHFLELSALFPQFGGGVVRRFVSLPGSEARTADFCGSTEGVAWPGELVAAYNGPSGRSTDAVVDLCIVERHSSFAVCEMLAQPSRVRLRVKADD